MFYTPPFFFLRCYDDYEICKNYSDCGEYHVVRDHDADIDDSEESAQEVCGSNRHIRCDLSVKCFDYNLWFVLIAFLFIFSAIRCPPFGEKLLAVAD